MSKDKRNKPIELDFFTGIGGVIPSSHEAYKDDGTLDRTIKKAEGISYVNFKQILEKKLDKDLKSLPKFPSVNNIFVLIIQYFANQTQYDCRDIDNMAKTILDALKGRCYKDDVQVSHLLVCKKIDSRIKQDFIYIAVKEIRQQSIHLLQSTIEKSITYYQQLQANKILP